MINKEEFNYAEGRSEIQKIFTGQVSEGFTDQKKELQALEIYLKDILTDDFKEEKNQQIVNKNLEY